MQPISLLLCEGYHDRAFWSGAVKRLGCVDARGRVLLDNWGERPGGLRKGGYLFVSDADTSRQLRIVPCENDDGVKQTIDIVLQEHPTKPVRHLLVSLDADTYGGGKVRAIEAIRDKLGDRVEPSSMPGVWRFKGSAMQAFGVIAWQPGAPAVGVPHQQCLERIVCSALAAAYPVRASHVAAWLAERPDKPSTHEAKSHAWSYMAAWCADRGGVEGFLESLWSDGRVVPHLIDALRGSNALEALHAVTGVKPQTLTS